MNIRDLYPDYVVKSDGTKEEFDESKITTLLNRETGLDIKIAREISEEIVKNLVLKGRNTVSSKYIREMACLKLTERNLYKHRELFSRDFQSKHIKFKLDLEFLRQYKKKNPNLTDLGYFVYKRTYARRIPRENRREKFWETMKRVVEGCYSIQKEHCKNLGLPWIEEKAQKSAQIMWEKIWNFKFTPPGRGFWMMGTDFVQRRGSMALNNCAFCSTKSIDIQGSKPFEFTMDALMLGVGVGFDVKGAEKITIKKPNDTDEVFEIPDSREGWVESLKLVLEGYLFGEPIPDFDYSLIRPAGAPIRGFGGVASGPDPLREMLNEINNMLDKKIGEKITSINILDIMNFIAKCVVAGNVRRSALLALGQPDDKDFLLAKQDKEKLKSHRWASNNSAIVHRGDDYSFIAEQMKKNGEPGVFWIENARNWGRTRESSNDSKILGTNPCGEIGLESYELCNLAETFPSNHESFEEYRETLKYAYLYAKSVTLVNTHWKETNAVMLKNRRMGISQTGITEAFKKHGRNEMLEWCGLGYKYLKKLDNKYSDWLCVPKSIKITTVKPSGTVSLLAGVTSGIHYPHSEYYIRRVRIASNSDLLDEVREMGYNIEDDKYSPKTKVIEFPIKKKYYDKGKKEVTIWEQAMNVADYQKYWSDNQISVTISFKDKEKDQIGSLLECFEDKVKSLTFMPLQKDVYEQAPYEEITKEKYEKLRKL